MKHLKLMMAALAMMMGLTMTSCFDDEDSYETVITSIAKLKQGLAGGYEFVTTEGFVIILMQLLLARWNRTIRLRWRIT